MNDAMMAPIRFVNILLTLLSPKWYMPSFNLAGRDTHHQPFLQGKTYDHSYLHLAETDDCNTVSQLHPLR
jgi:hypothetical protein